MKINNFLRQIASDIKITNKDYTALDFYYLLKYIGIKKDGSLAKDINSFYKEFLNNLDNSLVKYTKFSKNTNENMTHYIGFYVNKKADFREAVKVYFSVKYEYLISALKTVFMYIVRNNIKAVVKFHVKATNEGIVIRFYDEKDVLPFINYCNNNFVLRELLAPINPFMASIYGIGVVRDDNTESTFNKTLSKLLEEYFKLHKSENNFDNVGELDFLDFIIKRESIEENLIMKFNIKEVEKSIKAILNMTSPLEEKDLL